MILHNPKTITEPATQSSAFPNRDFRSPVIKRAIARISSQTMINAVGVMMDYSGLIFPPNVKKCGTAEKWRPERCELATLSAVATTGLFGLWVSSFHTVVDKAYSVDLNEVLGNSLKAFSLK